MLLCSVCAALATCVANLKGKDGTSTANSSGTYYLCKYHFEELKEDRWKNVALEGVEMLPEE